MVDKQAKIIYDDDWRSDALCLGKHSDYWFPPLFGNRQAYIAYGRMVCERCPVWAPCLQSGENEVHGMWGGLSNRERGSSPSVLHRHGSWQRYRQGCRCSECHDAEHGYKRPINLGQITGNMDEMPEPEVLKERIYNMSLPPL
jgi:hypothetical protein